MPLRTKEETMLDRNLVTDNLNLVRENLTRRNAGQGIFQELERLGVVIERRRQLQQETDDIRAERNRISKQIGPMMRGGKAAETEPLKQQVRRISERLTILDGERKGLETQENELLLSLPNMLADNVPPGHEEGDNELVSTHGTLGTFDFPPLEHHVLGVQQGMLDPERAVKVAGTRFSVLIGGFARLERALISFFLDEAGKNGYTELGVPYIVNRDAMIGTGQLPKFEADLFKLTAEVGGQEAYLIPTAEVPITNLHRHEILSEENLPLSYCSFTPCFRAEAGSYGKDTHGLIRQHQFHKVELVKITTPEQSTAAHETLTRDAQGLLEKLELPYRVMRLCGGDIGFSANMCYDLEVWLPGQAQYREISSCSNFGDFQARRMRMRYRPTGGGKVRTCHTVNGSGLAVGRTLVAIVENHQLADGRVRIPAVLRSYMGGEETIG